jgi:hypothetical protein
MIYEEPGMNSISPPEQSKPRSRAASSRSSSSHSGEKDENLNKEDAGYEETYFGTDRSFL